LKKWAENSRKKRKNEFFSHISPEILVRFLTGKELDVEEFSKMWINSYERRLLFPLFSDKLLLETLKYAIKQSGYRNLYEFDVPDHYNHAIESLYLPELIERFERKVADE